MNSEEYGKITTEKRNKNSEKIDQLSTIEILSVINNEDKTVAYVVEKSLKQIQSLVDRLYEVFEKGGRLIYIGAGTSGRIGLMDAVECRPTYSCSDEMIQCLMAGGIEAMVKAVEGAEDDEQAAINDLKKVGLTSNDMVVGIAASGRTPYTLSAMKYAKEVGCAVGCIVTSLNSPMAKVASYPIEVITGPEVVTGSTRMKAGTAQKLVCNMITTCTMIKMGKVYQNLMIDVQPTNIKLQQRALQILIEATGVSEDVAKEKLSKYKNVKKALFSIITKIDDEKYICDLLDKNNGNIQKALKEVNNG